jgi:prophage antirepressor-like protein
VAKDVAEALGYANTKEAVNEHCKGVAKRYPLKTAGGKQQVSIISEKDIYRLIFRSRLPEAEAFQVWVFDIIKRLREEVPGRSGKEAALPFQKWMAGEVLPSIRKTGACGIKAPSPALHGNT